MQVHAPIDYFKYLVEIASVDLRILIDVIQPEQILVFLLDLCPEVEYRQEVQEQLKVYAFCLGLAHLLLEQLQKTRVEHMLSQKADLFEVFEFDGLQLLAVKS